MLLTENNIMAELSYAYLHAIASRAGFGCSWGTRHDDGIGVDATLRVKERLASDSLLTQFTVDVQLKATASNLQTSDRGWHYSLPLKNYDELRNPECHAPQLLVMYLLPSNRSDWVIHSNERSICQTCAYWLSLRGAEDSSNSTSQTVYIPTENQLSVEKLRELCARFSKREDVPYVC